MIYFLKYWYDNILDDIFFKYWNDNILDRPVLTCQIYDPRSWDNDNIIQSKSK
jgi:hypothetical protein